MKKRGFTLAELLIVLGIAGVVAAVILPAINGLMPDKTKINYLKVYDELGKNIKALTSDSSIFPVLLKEGSTDIDVSKYPLVNNSQPLKAPFKDDTKYSGDNKLCNLLAHTFGADSCSTTSYPDKSSFTTSNGMEWWISQTKREINTADNKISYQTDIYVDVDSSKKSSNCMYGEDNCKQPDRFKFLLAADGRLVPADPVGVHYINTRKNLLKKKFDVEGEVLASLEDHIGDKNSSTTNDEQQEESHYTPEESVPPETEQENPEENGDIIEKSLACSGMFDDKLSIACFSNQLEPVYHTDNYYKNLTEMQTIMERAVTRHQDIFFNRLQRQFISLVNGWSSLPPRPYPQTNSITKDLSLYYDYGAICMGDITQSIAICYINSKYKNSSLISEYLREFDTGTILGKKEIKITYVDFENPAGKFLFPKGTTGHLYMKNHNVSFYNPLDKLDLSLYPAPLWPGPTMRLEMFLILTDTSPRYDDNNIYIILPNDSDNVYLDRTTIENWINNKQ